MTQSDAEALWQFAVRTYGQPGVTDACIELQDERGADVNMLLFSVWIGTTRGHLADAEFEAAERFSRQWRDDVVAPLRSARRWMKSDGCTMTGISSDDCLELRDRIKNNELAAEKLQLQTLAQLLSERAPLKLTASDQLASAADNLRKYCESADIALDDWSIERLAVILMAGVSSADLATIEAIFSG